MKYLTIENHPNDSRVLIKEDEICQTLSQRMGTGGGNVPMVMVIDDAEVDFDGSEGGQFMAWNTEGIVETLRSQMNGHPPIVVMDEDDNDDREEVL